MFQEHPPITILWPSFVRQKNWLLARHRPDQVYFPQWQYCELCLLVHNLWSSIADQRGRRRTSCLSRHTRQCTHGHFWSRLGRLSGNVLGQPCPTLAPWQSYCPPEAILFWNRRQPYLAYHRWRTPRWTWAARMSFPCCCSRSELSWAGCQVPVLQKQFTLVRSPTANILLSSTVAYVTTSSVPTEVACWLSIWPRLFHRMWWRMGQFWTNQPSPCCVDD